MKEPGSLANFDSMTAMIRGVSNYLNGKDLPMMGMKSRPTTHLKRARKRGEFYGVDENAFPRDFGGYVRYYTKLKEKIKARYPLPGPLALSQLDRLIQHAGHRYKVQWLEHEIGREQAAGAEV